MPTVKTVSVQYERKLNLGDFNSATVGITLWADIDEGENLDTAMRNLWEMATNNVKAKAQTFKVQTEAQAKEIYLGLPVELQAATDEAERPLTPLTWEELANIYDAGRPGGRPARTLPMEAVFDWAAKQTDRFIALEDGSIAQRRD